jgi:hypothetical protein
MIPSKPLVRDWTPMPCVFFTMSSGATMNTQVATVDQIQLGEVASFAQVNFE